MESCRTECNTRQTLGRAGAGPWTRTERKSSSDNTTGWRRLVCRDKKGKVRTDENMLGDVNRKLLLHENKSKSRQPIFIYSHNICQVSTISKIEIIMQKHVFESHCVILDNNFIVISVKCPASVWRIFDEVLCKNHIWGIIAKKVCLCNCVRMNTDWYIDRMYTQGQILYIACVSLF